MFTDIEAYTAVMQHDENRAIVLRTKHRKILEAEHERFHGRIVQYYGDGSLSTFHSAVEAVQSAIEMQLLFMQEGVPVRIGLHIGDVVFQNEQVIGDGVNLASRIESLGVAGSILMSERVHNEIINQPQIKTVSMGVFDFKNIDKPVEVFAVNHELIFVPQASSLKGKTKDKNVQNKSIAVLPFVNLSNEPGQEYFGDGIAEEILNSLTGLKDLKVAGRTSSFQFNRNDSNLREIGEKLGVSTVLEGSVRKQGSRLRVTV